MLKNFCHSVSKTFFELAGSQPHKAHKHFSTDIGILVTDFVGNQLKG